MRIRFWLATLFQKFTTRPVKPRRRGSRRILAAHPAAIEMLEPKRLLSVGRIALPAQATSNASPAINHAPSGTSGTVTTGENVAYTLKASDFGFTDPNDSPPNALQAVKITLLPNAGTLTDNGAAMTTNEFISAADISSGNLVFAPNANLMGGPFFLCKFQVQDNGGTANGGVNLDPTAKVLDIDIVHVNHAPVGTSGTVTAAENTPYTLKMSDFGFTDPNDGPPNTLQAVKFTLLPNSGTLKNNGIAVTVDQFVSASDISSGKLVFTPNTNLAGGPYFLCKFQVQDNGGTANGGVNLDPVAKVLDINLLKINHAPVGAANTVTTSENTPYVFNATDFGFSDPNDSPPNTLLDVKITTIPSVGMLTDKGVDVTAATTIPIADITGGKFDFVPGNGGSGAPYSTFTFQVQDNGGTANGGIDTDPTPRVMTVDVTTVSTAADVLVNSITSGNQIHPVVAQDTAGDYVVAWASYGQNGASYGIFAQRYNSIGQRQGSEFQVSTQTTGSQTHPAIAMDSAGDFVITWNSYLQNGASNGIYFQRYNLEGVTLGRQIQVDSYTPGIQSAPTVAMDSEGDFVVAWQNSDQANDDHNIYATRYNVEGNAVTSAFVVNTPTTAVQESPSVAMDAAGDFVVTWMGQNQNSSTFSIDAQRFNSFGQAEGVEFRVNPSITFQQSTPAVAMDSTGDFVITWDSYGQDGSQGGIFAQRYNAAGAAVGSEFRVNTDTAANQSNPAAAMDSRGDFVITWTSALEDGSSLGVYAQQYNSVGTAIGTEMRVNKFTTGAQANSSVSMDAQGDIVVTFDGTGLLNSGYDIYTQRYTHS